MMKRVGKIRKSGHRCALCTAQVSVEHYCYGCHNYVCTACAGQANERPLPDAHTLRHHLSIQPAQQPLQVAK